MKRTAMILALVLVASTAMADGGYLIGGGRTDDGTGNMGSGCCPAATTSQSSDDGGLIGPTGGRADGGGGTLGSGTRSEDGGYYGSGHSKAKQQREFKREFRLFGFLLAFFD